MISEIPEIPEEKGLDAEAMSGDDPELGSCLSPIDSVQCLEDLGNDTAALPFLMEDPELTADALRGFLVKFMTVSQSAVSYSSPILTLLRLEEIQSLDAIIERFHALANSQDLGIELLRENTLALADEYETLRLRLLQRYRSQNE